jgi:hypothetical protein
MLTECPPPFRARTVGWRDQTTRPAAMTMCSPAPKGNQGSMEVCGSVASRTMQSLGNYAQPRSSKSSLSISCAALKEC